MDAILYHDTSVSFTNDGTLYGENTWSSERCAGSDIQYPRAEVKKANTKRKDGYENSMRIQIPTQRDSLHLWGYQYALQHAMRINNSRVY